MKTLNIPYAEARGMTYIAERPKSPADIPEGKVLVHNILAVSPNQRIGARGFRAWLPAPEERLEPCNCGWVPEVGPHYRTGRDTELA